MPLLSSGLHFLSSSTLSHTHSAADVNGDAENVSIDVVALLHSIHSPPGRPPIGETKFTSPELHQRYLHQVYGLHTKVVDEVELLMGQPPRYRSSTRFYAALQTVRSRRGELSGWMRRVKAAHKALDANALHSEGEGWEEDVGAGQEEACRQRARDRPAADKMEEATANVVRAAADFAAAAVAGEAAAKAALAEAEAEGVFAADTEAAVKTATRKTEVAAEVVKGAEGLADAIEASFAGTAVMDEESGAESDG